VLTDALQTPVHDDSLACHAASRASSWDIAISGTQRLIWLGITFGAQPGPEALCALLSRRVLEHIWGFTPSNKLDTFAPRVLTQAKLLALRGSFSDIAGNDSQRSREFA
jgi:hypothetical protein